MGSFFESEFMLSNSLHFVLLTCALALAFHLPIWCVRIPVIPDTGSGLTGRLISLTFL